MPKYRVAIARNETTVYYIDVEAEHEGIAEDIAFEEYYIEGDYVSKEVVWAEEEVHSVEEVDDEND
jgi:hypothetical protein